MSPKFTISMLALDGLEMSKACIGSIIGNSTSGAYRLFLTNNGSKDGTKEYFDELAARFDFITVIHNEKNEVFIGPNNHVFELARKLGATYNITINNDLIVPPLWLEKLEEQFTRNPKAAIVGPQGTISCLSDRMLGNSRARLEFIEGSLMCCKIAIVEQYGPMFSDYLVDIYHDDSDLSLRMQRAGYTIHQADFIVQHRNGSTCTRHPEAIARCRAANAKNQQTMLREWAHWNRVRRFSFPILIRRKFAVGDVLLLTPIIKALKEKWPLCSIDVETGSPDVLRGNPHIRMIGPRIQVTALTWVIDMNGAYEANPTVHVLESYANRAMVHPLKSPRLEIYTSAKVTPMDGKWAAVHIGPTTWPGKNWPPDRWAEITAWLRQLGWKVMLLGDRSLLRIEHDLDLRGQKGQQELIALMKQCTLFVGLDSFPAHAASALDIPAVVLYGITNPDCFKVPSAPYIAVRSSPDHPDTGKRNRLRGVTFVPSSDSVMRTISTDMVKAAVTEIATTL